MRKWIFILVLFVIAAITARGQTATFFIDADDNISTINTNYTLTNTTVVSFQWDAARGMPATQDFQCNLDSLTGDHTNIAIKLYGRKFSNRDWEQIGSTVNSTDADATEDIENTTPNRYREYLAEYTPTGTGTTRIDFQILRIWNE